MSELDYGLPPFSPRPMRVEHLTPTEGEVIDRIRQIAADATRIETKRVAQVQHGPLENAYSILQGTYYTDDPVELERAIEDAMAEIRKVMQ